MADAAQMYERRYRQCREQGLPGWFSGETLEGVLAHLAERMRSGRLPETGCVLEIGCGAGDQSLLLAEMGYTVCGVDVAPTSVAWAHEKAGRRGLRAVFRVGDAHALAGFSDGCFDLVLDGNCLHFVIGEERGRVLRNARRVLRPGGWLLVTSICTEPGDSVLAADYDPSTRCYVQDGVAYTYQGRAEDIRVEVLAAGLEIAWQEVTPAVAGVQAACLRLDARHLP